MQRINCLSREEWLLKRRNGIGSSDAPALLDVPGYTWGTPWSIWAEKRGLLAPKKTSSAMRLGHLLEPVVAKLYEEQSGEPVIDTGDHCLFFNEDRNYQFCTPDRLTPMRYVEIKIVGGGIFNLWKKGLPLAYQIQCQHQLAALDADLVTIVALFGQDFTIRTFNIYRHERLIKAMNGIESDFWSMVTEKEPPDVIARDSEHVQRIIVDPDTPTVELDRSFLEIDRERQQLEEEIKAATEAKSKLDAQVKSAIGQAEVATINGVEAFSFKANSRGARTLRRLFSGELPIHEPTLAEELATVSI